MSTPDKARCSGMDMMSMERDWLNTLFGHVPDQYEGDAERFLAICDLVDEEVKNAIALIMRKCNCEVVFGDNEHEIDATAGGRVGEIYGSVGGKRKIAILIGDQAFRH